MFSRSTMRSQLALVAAATAVALVGSVVTVNSAAATPAGGGGVVVPNGAPSVQTSKHSLAGVAAKSAMGLPQGVPAKGRYAFLLQLDAQSTSRVFNHVKASSTIASAKSAAASQLRAVSAAQGRVIAALPGQTQVLYRLHALMAGVAVSTDVSNYSKLRAISNVAAVYPIAPKTISNSYAVPLQKAPQAWEATGDLGANATVAIIDTGVDYTHANFNGLGSPAAYQAALTTDTAPVNKSVLDGNKFNLSTTDSNGNLAGFYDFAGDNYDASSSAAAMSTPHPDPNPLDCNGHGSHVAGTVAGYGENANGSTYTGSYDTNTPFDTMRIGPGMAPKARLYVYKVFGCQGSTNVTAEALDKAMDPNGDGNTADHVDVVNMSLGTDYGSPQDGDSVVANMAVQAGITVVAASGNAGDIYDVGGSPGNATQVIAAAASADNYSQLDALQFAIDGTNQAPVGAERAAAYDWTKPDLGSLALGPNANKVARVATAGNLDGCKALNAADAAAVKGKIAFVEWTDNDTNRMCGSAARAANLANAGAKGFIFADDQETFSAGITGAAAIPGVLVTKSAGDVMRTALLAGKSVTVGGTTANGFRQVISGLDDTIASFSSRGIGDAGNVKPDVTAVGQTVFSTGMGTGNQGLNDSGTSMATPMVAGEAALVASIHKTGPSAWTPEQIKADIMNTADQQVFTGANHSGDPYGPQRVGAGRIDAKAAVGNDVVAYNADDHGAVSVSFGPVEATGAATVTRAKTVTVDNTGASTATYNVGYEPLTTIPGVDYQISPSSVSVDAGQTATVTVTLTIDPTQLTKTIDPTVDPMQDGSPRVYQADASGLVQLISTSGGTDLRVPVYSAPRPASTMSQPASITMPHGTAPQALLALSGSPIDQGTGAARTQSLVAGFELTAKSNALPNCGGSTTTGCVAFPDERSADIKYVGVTSDSYQLSRVGIDPVANSSTYFAITTQGAWRTAASSQEFDVLIDTNGDGNPEYALFNTRVTSSSDTDVLVSALANLTTNKVTLEAPLNAAFGDTDTALLNSNTLVMPVLNADLKLPRPDARFRYAVDSFSPYEGAPLDAAGFDGAGNLGLSFAPANPGLAVFGSFTGTGSPLLFQDKPAASLRMRRINGAYVADHGLGALIVHFQNANSNKAQLVSLVKQRPSVSLHLTPNPDTVGERATAAVTVTADSGNPTGTVWLKRSTGAVVGHAALINGKATIRFTPTTVGTMKYFASYGADAVYLGQTSRTISQAVWRIGPTVRSSYSTHSVQARHSFFDSVTVSKVNGLTPTGRVDLMRLNGRGAWTSVTHASLSGGHVTLHFAPGSTGQIKFRVYYGGDSHYRGGNSAAVTITVTR